VQYAPELFEFDIDGSPSECIHVAGAEPAG
jgi:hypothetical protein